MAEYAYDGVAEAFRDPQLALVRFTGATVTPEAVVVADARVAYRGRIDNRYVELGRERPAATERDLFDALSAIVAGKPAPHKATPAVGCFIADLAR